MRRLGDSDPSLRIITIQHIDVPFSTHRGSSSRFCPMHGSSSISHRKALCLTMNAGGESRYVNYRTASMSFVLTKNTDTPVPGSVNYPEMDGIAPGTHKGCHYISAITSVKCSGTPCGCQDNSQTLTPVLSLLAFCLTLSLGAGRND